MTALEIYQPPFRHDGAYLYSSTGVMALMAAECGGDPEKLAGRTCEVLNGESPSVGNPNIEYQGGEIFNGPRLLLVIRGFSHLTSKDGLNLSVEEALKLQDEFGKWVVMKLRNETDN